MTPQRPHTQPEQGKALAGLLLVALSGCSSPPTALEQSLGTHVRQAVAQQTVPASRPRGAQVTDGVIAAHGIDRYEQSYQRPPAPVSVLNILTGSGSAPATSTTMPR